MKKINSIEDVIRNDLCISCGTCAGLFKEHIEMRYDKKKGVPLPKIKNKINSLERNLILKICPGKGYDIRKLSKEIFGEEVETSYELGTFIEHFVATSLDTNIIKNASSGGVMTEIGLFLLKIKYVDGVITTKFKYGQSGPKSFSYIAYSREELIEGQGSKYCPTSPNTLIDYCLKSGKRYLFIGTPCQIAGLRLAEKENQMIKLVFPIKIGNFCGGYKNYKSLNNLITKNGFDIAKVNYFQFRGNGQPGSLKIVTTDDQMYEEKYPDYARKDVIQKRKRCTLCVDATAELADISCGDAWLDKYIKSNNQWSTVIVRSKEGQKILNEMKLRELIRIEPITINEIIKSQWQNIESKKYRQYKRLKIYKLFLEVVPNFYGGLIANQSSYYRELKIYLSKKVSSFINRKKQ